MESTVTFNSDVESITNMAIFIAQLVREGVAFRTEFCNGVYRIELTGGF